MISFQRIRSDSGSSVPFHYSPEAVYTGSRIGGNHPETVVPFFQTPYQKYFGTLEFDTGFSLTIFYSFEIYEKEPDPGRDIMNYSYQRLPPSELIHAVVHQGSAGAALPFVPAEVSCHKLVFDALAPDLFEREGEADDFREDEDERPYLTSNDDGRFRRRIAIPESKIGGLPYTDNRPLARETFIKLLEEGYWQVAQFQTPGNEELDYLNQFPWDPGWLHLFARGTTVEELEFAFVVQF